MKKLGPYNQPFDAVISLNASSATHTCKMVLYRIFAISVLFPLPIFMIGYLISHLNFFVGSAIVTFSGVLSMGMPIILMLAVFWCFLQSFGREESSQNEMA